MINDIRIEHKFHLVPDEVDIPTDGIIGKDFIKLRKCTLDYNNNKFIIRLPFTNISLPILSEFKKDYAIIPAKSEVYRLFNFEEDIFPRYIKQQKLSEDVEVNETIVYQKTSYVRTVNKSERNIPINITSIKSEPLFENYKVFSTENISSTRNEDLIKILKPNLSENAPKELINLCTKYSRNFYMPGDMASVNNFYEQELKVKDEIPVFVKNYRLPQTQKDEIKRQVQELLEKDLIEFSTSNYNSPLIIVPKKSQNNTQKWRLCVDYRLLNRKLIPDKFPIARIDDILDNLGKTKYFSILDLHSGFHQIPLAESSRPYTAFSTDNGFYQWKVLPFGLNIAPNSFSRMMAMAFSELCPNKAFTYIDDLICIGATSSEHLNNLESVFKICEKYNLKLNPEKCKFFEKEVNFLGFRCTENGILPDNSKNEILENYPTPNDKDSVKRFVAFANYYRKFIPNFSDICRPLNSLTKKRAEFYWSTDCELAFQKIKNSLLSPRILKYPDFSKPFLVTVDASNFACGAVLSQNNFGEDLPVAFISKTFKKGEINKPIIEKELMAIHFAIMYFKSYLYGRPFTVKSDHKPLIYLYNLKNPSSKLTRLRLDLEEYDFTIEYIRGRDNVAADALSRIHMKDLKSFEEEKSILVTTRSQTKMVQNRLSNKNNHNDIKNNRINLVEELGCTYDKNIARLRTTNIIRNKGIITGIEITAYMKHKRIFKIKSVNERLTLKLVFLQLQEATDEMNINKLQWPKNDKIFEICNYNDFKCACEINLKNLQIILINEPLIISKKNEQIAILEKFHNDPIYGGHCGTKKLYAKLRNFYYWKGMTKDIGRFIRNCETCLLNKPKTRTKEEMVITPTPQKPFDVVIIDTVGPLQVTDEKNIYVLTMICDLSKYLISVPMKTKTATEIAKSIFEKCILVYGPMKEIRTDLGTEYKNNITCELFKLMNIQHKTSTPYHHQTVGTVERCHRTFNEYLRSYLVNEFDKWDIYLHYFTFCYNITTHGSNNNKYSPYELVFGRKVNLPNSLLNGNIEPLYNVENYVKTMKYMLQTAHEKTRKIIEFMKKQNKLQYDRNINPVNIKKGDRILLKNEPYNKRNRIYLGPFIVKNIQEPNVEIIIDKNKTKTVHKNEVIKTDYIN